MIEGKKEKKKNDGKVNSSGNIIFVIGGLYLIGWIAAPKIFEDIKKPKERVKMGQNNLRHLERFLWEGVNISDSLEDIEAKNHDLQQYIKLVNEYKEGLALYQEELNEIRQLKKMSESLREKRYNLTKGHKPQLQEISRILHSIIQEIEGEDALDEEILQKEDWKATPVQLIEVLLEIMEIEGEGRD